jgi:diguanylate cyclase (GGDEF)-like protein
MSLSRHRGVHGRRLSPKAWEVWRLPHRLLTFVVLIISLYAIAIAFAVDTALGHTAETFGLRNLAVFGLLLLCSVATVEMTRRPGESVPMAKDVYGIWELPIAILLPPVYVLIAPLPRFLLSQWRVRRVLAYRRVFNLSAISLSYGVASWVFHSGFGMTFTSLPTSGHQTSLLIGAVAACMAIQWALNNFVVLTAVKQADPAVQVRTMLFGRESLHNDTTELCVAALVTLGVAVNPLTLAFALPFVTLLQRSSRHSQLINDSRVDGKTGLLNAGTWDREASAEVARAVRTRSPAAVALMDIDDFKLVNDQHGHLAGDRALASVASTIKIFLRDYDLVGRFGGEEFAVLLPQTSELDARRIAERMRAQIAEMPIEVGDAAEVETIKLTVSVGLSNLSIETTQLTDLLAAADVALYHAKHAGKNQVWMTGDTDPARTASCSDAPDLSDAPHLAPPAELLPERAAGE